MVNLPDKEVKVPWLKAASTYMKHEKPKALDVPKYPDPVPYEEVFKTLEGVLNNYNRTRVEDAIFYEEKCLDCTTCEESCKLIPPSQDSLQIKSRVYGRYGALTRVQIEETELRENDVEEDLKVNPGGEVSGW
jgi:hypothetical protein